MAPFAPRDSRFGANVQNGAHDGPAPVVYLDINPGATEFIAILSSFIVKFVLLAKENNVSGTRVLYVTSPPAFIFIFLRINNIHIKMIG